MSVYMYLRIYMVVRTKLNHGTYQLTLVFRIAAPCYNNACRARPIWQAYCGPARVLLQDLWSWDFIE